MTTFRHEFEVEGPPADAWSRLVAAQPAELAPPTAPRRWWLPGFESTGEELEVDEAARLSVRKDAFPCEDTTITLSFVHTATGTRITVVQSGFDEAFIEAAGEAFWITAEQIGVDVELFFSRGVAGGRHARPWAFLGCDTAPTSVGLEVTTVMPETWAAKAGLEPGDLILTLAGAPIVATRDLVTVLRVVGAGTEVAVTASRGDQLISAAAVL